VAKSAEAQTYFIHVDVTMSGNHSEQLQK